MVNLNIYKKGTPVKRWIIILGEHLDIFMFKKISFLFLLLFIINFYCFFNLFIFNTIDR